MQSELTQPLTPKLPIKFYLAASVFRKDFVIDQVQRLEDLGFQCSFDWASAYVPGVDVSAKEIEAVVNSDFLILIPGDTRGCHVEYGAALAAKKLGKQIKTIIISIDPMPAPIPFYGQSDHEADELATRIYATKLDCSDAFAEYVCFVMLNLLQKDVKFFASKVFDIYQKYRVLDGINTRSHNPEKTFKSLQPVLNFVSDFISLAEQKTVLNKRSKTRLKAYLKGELTELQFPKNSKGFYSFELKWLSKEIDLL